jgi:hypothetical protein
MSFRRDRMAVVVVGTCVVMAGACAKQEEPPATSASQQASPPPAASTAAPPADVSAAPAAPYGDAATPPAGADASGTAAATTGTPEFAAEPQQGEAGAARPLAVEDHEVPGVQVALMDVRRTSGDTVTVRLQFRNTTDQEVSNSLFYSDGIVAAMYLLDNDSKKKHLVVRDAENKPVGFIGRTPEIPAKGALAVWARFPAPPANVSKMTISVPGIPPFDDVPLK